MFRPFLCLSLTALVLANPARAAEQAPACANAGPLTVYVVRHAERQEDGTDDPGLNDAGQARAEALAMVLADVQIGAVHVSRFRRTLETAAAVIEGSNLEVRTWPVTWAGVTEHVQALATGICSEYRDQSVLVVGHSNTVSPVVKALSGLEVEELSERDFDRLFQVRLLPDQPAELLRARYGHFDPPTNNDADNDSPL